MKLASYKDGSRDGQLIVVSRDLKTAHYATGVASRLQHLMDDWGFVSPQLQDIYDGLNQGRLRHSFPFEPAHCAAPLPRAYGWEGYLAEHEADDSAIRVQRWPSDTLLGAADGAERAAVAGDRCAVALAAVLGDVPAFATVGQALDSVRLLGTAMIYVASAAQHEACEAMTTQFACVVVTPDELEGAWKGGRLDASLRVSPRRVGKDSFIAPEARLPSLGPVLVQATKGRSIAAGSMVGAGIWLPKTALEAGAHGLHVSFRTAHGDAPMGVIDPPRHSPDPDAKPGAGSDTGSAAPT